MSIWDKERTICWDCQKTCGGCSWSREFKPVEGWEAVETTDYAGDKSFLVRKCPEFVREISRKRDADKLDTDGCLALIEKMLQTAKNDYIEGTDEMQHQIERFLKGKGASKIHMITDPDNVIKKLKLASNDYRLKREADDLIDSLGRIVGRMDAYKDILERTINIMKRKKPMNATTDKFNHRICPRCNSVLHGRYCSECGQEVRTDA